MNTSTIVTFFEALLRLGASIDKDHAENFGSVLSALALGKALVAQGDAAKEQLEQLTADIEGMVAEGRNPTAEEFQALKGRFDSAYSAALDYLNSQGESSPDAPVVDRDDT